MKASLADQFDKEAFSSPKAPEEGASDAAKIRYKYPLSAIHILKVHGKSSLESAEPALAQQPVAGLLA
jgi:hypothetical protein